MLYMELVFSDDIGYFAVPGRMVLSVGSRVRRCHPGCLRCHPLTVVY